MLCINLLCQFYYYMIFFCCFSLPLTFFGNRCVQVTLACFIPLSISIWKQIYVCSYEHKAANALCMCIRDNETHAHKAKQKRGFSCGSYWRVGAKTKHQQEEDNDDDYYKKGKQFITLIFSQSCSEYTSKCGVDPVDWYNYDPLFSVKCAHDVVGEEKILCMQCLGALSFSEKQK